MSPRAEWLAGGSTTRAIVTSTEVTLEKGLFNPYTTGGYIVVDGMVVSGGARMGGCFPGAMFSMAAREPNATSVHC